MTKKDRIMRVDESFAEEIDEIKIKRIKSGKDKKLLSDTKITSVIRKHNFWEQIKKDIINHTFGKRGQGGIGISLIIFIVIAFVTMMFFGMWLFFNQTIVDSITSIPSVPGEAVNMSQAATDTFGTVNDALLPGLKAVSLMIIFGMALTMLIVEYFSRKHPALFILDFFVVIIAFILSVFISNRYEEFLVGQVISGNLLALTQGTSIMLHLPRWVAVIGLFGIGLSLIGIIRRRDTGGFQ